MMGPISQMYIRMIQGSLREGKRSHRLELARNDEILEIFRGHKNSLRMQLLTGGAGERGRMLRAAFVVRARV
jgi:hypothetical protein